MRSLTAREDLTPEEKLHHNIALINHNNWELTLIKMVVLSSCLSQSSARTSALVFSYLFGAYDVDWEFLKG